MQKVYSTRDVWGGVKRVCGRSKCMRSVKEGSVEDMQVRKECERKMLET